MMSGAEQMAGSMKSLMEFDHQLIVTSQQLIKDRQNK
jgi:hypothetical protein